LRAARWAHQQKLGVTHIPSNDFSLYDHVLDTSAMVGASLKSMAGRVAKFRLAPISPWHAARMTRRMMIGASVTARMARACRAGNDEMVRYQYHYMVPEFVQRQTSRLHPPNRSMNSWKRRR